MSGTLSAVAAANSIDFRCRESAKGHGNAASVQGDTGSTAFSILHDSLIRDCRPNSLHHPIHVCAHSRLDGCGVGSGVGAGAVVSCVVSSGVVDDVDDACVGGSAFDVIRPGCNSVIQSFSEYHDSSCARLNALQNSHLECGRHVHGGMNRSSTGSLCNVRLSAGKKRSFSQQQSRKVHGEMYRVRGFPGRWKSFRGVLSRWLVLRVQITLLCHLGQAEFFGTCWVGHSWRK